MLTRASLRYYAATNALVVLGVAVAVAVLAGALLVGESVRASLRDLAVGRLGNTDAIVTSPTFFRAALADDISGSRLPAPGSRVKDVVPLIAINGAVSSQETRRTAGTVSVYGINDRFWAFHGITPPSVDFTASPANRNALISQALASELGVKTGDSIMLRIAKPTDIPLSSIQGRREGTGVRIRLTVAGVLDRSSLGEFSLSPSQGPVLALYVPMSRLFNDLELSARVNMMLFSLNEDAGDLVYEVVRPSADLDDFGLRTRRSPENAPIIETRAGLLPDALAEGVRSAVADAGLRTQPVLTYVANTIRARDREIPYSVVSAIDLPIETGDASPPPIWLNQWAADDLKAKVGDEVTLDYFLWSDADGLTTSSAKFVCAGILPMKGIGGDTTLTPIYPGITDAENIGDWDPPFPVDLKRVRKQDEDYWDTYRAAPKAIVTLRDGRRLWGSRYGNASSLRVSGDFQLNAQSLDPGAAGFTARLVRADAIAASQGTTDFGEYFLYFSFFLVVSALLLAYLFFAVGLEQRTTEVGILASMGFSPSKIRGVFVREGAILAAIGAAIGTVAAVGYSALILYGLRTWWLGAVGTTDLTLHIAPQLLAAGAIGAFAIGMLALWLGVRAMSKRSARSLLKGDYIWGLAPNVALPKGGYVWGQPPNVVAIRVIALLMLVLGAALLGAAISGAIDPTGGFFGAGGAWLVGGLCAASIYLRRRRSSGNLRRGLAGMFALGIRHTSVRPARSVLSLALIAFASFVLVSVGAFQKDVSGSNDPAAGTGGFSLMAESVAPLMHDPNTPDGRESLAFESADPILSMASITRFRLRPGDETSCLTLYRPTNPRIIAPEPRFFSQPRFSFASSMATSPEEIANPWLLLNRTFDDGAIAAIADQTTLMYVLHLGVGGDFTFTPEGSGPVKLRIVGALADSFLQSELIIGEAAFIKLFPKQEGYRVWMIDTPSENRAALTTHLEDRLSDFGVDVIDTRERWAAYHQVENTYLATFQALGSLGLLLGTVGLGAVLARNVLERRREIGLLRAVGYSPADVRSMVLSEGLALVTGGLLLGAGCAIVAIVPALRDRAQSVPLINLGGLLLAVFVTGAIAALAAIRITSRTPVLTAIKSE
ncbi:MAG: ABC transporter permease [Cyanobacteria bacterium]|nr:ABC transporter permease [Cyanobacteriota bacterium]